MSNATERWKARGYVWVMGDIEIGPDGAAIFRRVGSYSNVTYNIDPSVKPPVIDHSMSIIAKVKKGERDLSVGPVIGFEEDEDSP